MLKGFTYRRRVAFHETDAMGVVHHSNHIKYFEEARVEWLRDKGLTDIHVPAGPYVFAVVDVAVQYLKSARFDDLLEVVVEARLKGVSIFFRYAIWSERLAAWIATGTTTLVPLGPDMRVKRLPADSNITFYKGEWTGEAAVWPPDRD